MGKNKGKKKADPAPGTAPVEEVKTEEPVVAPVDAAPQKPVEEAKVETPVVEAKKVEEKAKPEITIVDDAEDQKKADQATAPVPSPSSKKNKKKKSGATPSAAAATQSINDALKAAVQTPPKA